MMNLTDPRRVSKRAFVRAVAARAGLPIKDADAFCDAYLACVLDYARANVQVTLTGFGKFYWQRHGGHKVQFGGGAKQDYLVLKFSASDATNAFLAHDDDQARTTRVPGTKRLLDAA